MTGNTGCPIFDARPRLPHSRDEPPLPSADVRALASLVNASLHFPQLTVAWLPSVDIQNLTSLNRGEPSVSTVDIQALTSLS